MKRSEVKDSDCPEFYRGYLNTIPEDAELVQFLENQLNNFPQFIRSIPEEKWNYSYGPGKWTVAQVLLHLLDTERVFQYRALRFGRKDATPLAGFDQDEWAAQNPEAKYSREEIVESFETVRKATVELFSRFSREDLDFKGRASDQFISLGALGFIMCGHIRYHRGILRERYL